MKKISLLITSLVLTINLSSQAGWYYQNSKFSNNSYGAIYALNKDTVYVIADKGIFNKSLDGGLNWTEFNTGFNELFFDLEFFDSDTGYCVGGNGKIIKTIDGGRNWISLNTLKTKNIYSIFLRSASEIWAVGDSGLILNSTDYGITWKQLLIVDKRLNGIGFKDNIGIIVGNAGTIIKSIDYGLNWTIENLKTTNDIYSLCITNKFVYAFSGTVFNNSFNADEIMQSSDFENWKIIPIYSGIPGLSKLCFVNDSVGFSVNTACTTNGDCILIVNKTDNYAENWKESTRKNSYPMESIGTGYSDLFFVNDTVGYILTGNSIFKTSDGGIYVKLKIASYASLINVYPNPLVAGELNIENKTNVDLALKIVDFNGKNLIERTINSSTESIDLSGLINGIYILKVFNQTGFLETKKILIQR